MSYYQNNREIIIEKQKQYNSKKREEISEYNKKYYHQRKDNINLYRKLRKEFIHMGPITIKKDIIVSFI